MGLKIRNIRITNFRSIRELKISPGRLSVLVGMNDSGKSNVLRALNLFFNDATVPDQELDFETDHNVHNKPNRKAKEISVRIDFDLPQSYRGTNGDIVTWEKRWRQGGLVHDEYVGKRRQEGSRGAVSWKPVVIPNRSNLHGLLRNIVFVYVPAIKDVEYFSELRSSIYDVIAEVADREFRNSSRDFELAISTQLKDLTKEISDSLGFGSRLALPKDLRHIFESLDFLSDNENLSLEVRGDGIKARHIPLILKFMADQKRGLQTQGAPPHTFIWAYEEPENSLEFSSSVKLSDQLLNFTKTGVDQMLVTTHSPVFYNLHKRQDANTQNIRCHHVYQIDAHTGTQSSTELSDLDERMGTTALLAPLAESLEKQIRQQAAIEQKVEALARANHRKLFVEGPTDKLIFDKAIKVFAGGRRKDINVVTQDSAGINYVIDMLSAWRSRAKHHKKQPKAAGLLDLDPDAKDAANAWNKVPDNVKSAKCFKLPTPPQLIPVFEAGFSPHVVLESVYDKKAWLWARDEGYLVDNNISEITPRNLTNSILKGETQLNEHLDDDWSIFVTHKIDPAKKKQIAKHFANLPDEEFRERFRCLEKIVTDISEYLFDKPAPNP